VTQGSSTGAEPKAFGPFILERRIAVGGSAEVFLARPKLGVVPAPRLVVKRLLPANREAEEYDRLEREARLHKAVVHPNVVTVFGAGMVGDEPYLAMEYVEGVDLYRLVRRAEGEERRIPVELAVYVVRRVAEALDSVHSAKDESGQELHIIHRDVTPSNVYLSVDGDVKLGDFGIARMKNRSKGAKPTAGLKGKFGYLSPEQVAGEPFDHRADLFSLAVLLGELLIGERVFPGSGQLAVLLAIRDVNIEPLRRYAPQLPTALFQVCEKALARAPGDRFQSAHDLAEALAPFEQPSADALKATLAEWVTWAQDSSRLAKQLEGKIRDSVERMRAVQLAGGTPVAKLSRPTIASPSGASDVVCAGGRRLEAVAFPALVEMIATGELGPDDQVALMGAELRRISEIDELARHLLPSTTATTGRLFEPGAPDYEALLAESGMIDVLAHMRRHAETGALFVERRDPAGGARRKEIYLKSGRLLHVASTERAELLGEYLVRRGSLSRAQLEQALGLLGRHGGRLGDTLISLGLVDAMDVFRAIRDQGRDRVAALCGWHRGTVVFYRDTGPAHVEFPLDLDLSSPMMAGAIVASGGNPRSLLPDGATRVVAGPRARAASRRDERGTAPLSLQVIADLCDRELTLDELLGHVTARRGARDARVVSAKEACAAIHTARAFGWIAL
jgi:eukaryotic-like serine/threonine-protein kinase